MSKFPKFLTKKPDNNPTHTPTNTSTSTSTLQQSDTNLKKKATVDDNVTVVSFVQSSPSVTLQSASTPPALNGSASGEAGGVKCLSSTSAASSVGFVPAVVNPENPEGRPSRQIFSSHRPMTASPLHKPPQTQTTDSPTPLNKPLFKSPSSPKLTSEAEEPTPLHKSNTPPELPVFSKASSINSSNLSRTWIPPGARPSRANTVVRPKPYHINMEPPIAEEIHRVWVKIGKGCDPVQIVVPSKCSYSTLKQVVRKNREFSEHFEEGVEYEITIYTSSGSLELWKKVKNLNMEIELTIDIILMKLVELSKSSSDEELPSNTASSTNPSLTATPATTSKENTFSLMDISSTLSERLQSISRFYIPKIKEATQENTIKNVEPAKLNPYLQRVLEKMINPASNLFKDRKKLGFITKPKRSASGSEIVDWLVADKQADSRDRAVDIGRALIYFNLISNSDGNDFKDDSSLFYSPVVTTEEEIDFKSLITQPQNYESFMQEDAKIKSFSIEQKKAWLKETGLQALLTSDEDPEGNTDYTVTLQLDWISSSEFKFSMDWNKFTISIEKSSLKTTLDLLLVDPYSPIGHIFNINEYITNFLYTLFSYTEPIDFLKYLINRYNESNQIELKQRILLVLSEWMQIENGLDFFNDLLISALQSFISKSISLTQPKEKFSNIARYFENKLDDLCANKKAVASDGYFPKKYNTFPPESNFKSSFLMANTIVNIDPTELARQITLIIESYILLLSRKELLKNNFAKDREKRAPYFHKLFEFSSHLFGCVVADILKEPLIEKQIDNFNYFLKLGEEFKKLNNFFGLGIIIGALNGAATQKLKKLFLKLDKTALKKFESLKTYVIPNVDTTDDPSQVAVEAARDNHLAYIPLFHCRYLGISALTKLNEISSDLLKPPDGPEGWINWTKMTKVSKIVYFLKSAKVQYNLWSVPAIQNHVIDCESWANENISCKIALLRNDFDSWTERPKREETFRLWDGDWLEMQEEEWVYIYTNIGCTLKLCRCSEMILHTTDKSPPAFRFLDGKVSSFQLNNAHPVQCELEEKFFGELSICKKHEACSLIAETNVALYELKIERLIYIALKEERTGRKLLWYIANMVSRRYQRKLGGTPKEDKGNLVVVSPEKREEYTLEEGELKLHEFNSRYHLTKDTLLVITDKRLILIMGKKTSIKNFVDIKEVKLNNKKDTIKIDSSVSVECSNENNLLFIYNLISHLVKRKGNYPEQGFPIPGAESFEEVDSARLALNETDWDLILSRAQKVTLQPEELFLQKGDRVRPVLYFIESGSVVEYSDNPEVHYTLKKGDFLAVATFLRKLPTAPTTIKCCEKTVLVQIEAYLLNVLFQHYPAVIPRFFYQIATSMADKLHQIV